MHADAVREKRAQRTRFTRLGLTSIVATLAAIGVHLLHPSVASAQDTPSAVRAATMDPSETEYPAPTAGRKLQLEFHGGAEIDLGFAKYTFPGDPNHYTENFFDGRGRFVLGADLDYEFARGTFFHVRGQVVDWIRESAGLYSVNADDVYLQVGQRDVWDFLVGRFMTWRVYQKGLGFDIYTLEDTGALAHHQYNFTSPAFGPHVYEANTIFLRGTQGRAGFHVYPTNWSGIEVVGEYGRDGTVNSIGGRGAGKATLGPARLSAGLEAKHVNPAVDNPACEKCGTVNTVGYAGGLVLDFHLVELAVDYGRVHNSVYDIKFGEYDKASSGHVASVGGYLELDPGTLLMQRRLVIGAGLNRTESLLDDNNQDVHVQGA